MSASTESTTATVSHWTREHVSKFSATADNTFPTFDLSEIKVFMNGFDIWDSWLALDEQGNVASICGNHVLCALGKSNWGTYQKAHIFYFYSQDGRSFAVGDTLLPELLVKDGQEWSGSTLLRSDGKVQTFYTVATGCVREGIWQTSQRLATAIQTPSINELGALVFTAPEYHRMLLSPDGTYYQTVDQADDAELQAPTQHNHAIGDDQVNNLCFRDPFFFKDPSTQKAYLLFEANTGTQYAPEGAVLRDYIGSDDAEPHYQPTVDDLKANGCVGIAEFTDQHYTQVRLLPPLLTTNLVTDEVERITLLHRDNSYYLFFVTHGNKMTVAGDAYTNRDLLVGFKASSLFGPYSPLNDSGIVLQQKSEGQMYNGQDTNTQYVYSWTVLPDLSVLCYSNFSSDGEGQPIKRKSVGPCAQLAFDGMRTKVTGISYPFVPAPVEEEEYDDDDDD